MPNITWVDAFTSKAFSGNPAAICILDEMPDDVWLQDVAREMNLSETAYLVPLDDGYQLRWFTPAYEVELCGHATLASAHVLWEQSLLSSNDSARFHTLSGLLTARREDGWIILDFPAKVAAQTVAADNLLESLGIQTPRFVGRNQFDLLVEVESADELRGLKPDFGKLKSVECRGVIVTASSDLAEYDFLSRFFAPAAGVDEDPVTGSAHCCLAPYWSEKLGTERLTARQISQRGGDLRLTVAGDRVLLGGQAITVMRGELL